jgi:hypothetical protein
MSNLIVPQAILSEWIVIVNRLPRKTSKLMYMVPVPQTDTGRVVENTEALE